MRLTSQQGSHHAMLAACDVSKKLRLVGVNYSCVREAVRVLRSAIAKLTRALHVGMRLVAWGRRYKKSILHFLARQLYLQSQPEVVRVYVRYIRLCLITET